MEHHHSEHKPDRMSHTMKEGHDMTGSKGGNHISPAMGAVLMSASTVIVAINARLLRMKTEKKD